MKRSKLYRDNLVMSTTNGRAKKSNALELVPAGDGQDRELMAFIDSLIDQNAELAAKLENIDSLTELAEKTVIEAGREAEEIKLEAEKEANARAAAIVARAEGKAKAVAQKVVAKAKEKAEAEARRIIAEAGQRAEESVQERLSLAEQQAQEMMRAAEEKSSLIRAEAWLITKEAEQLLASSRQTTEGPEKVSGETSDKPEGAEKPGQHRWKRVTKLLDYSYPLLLYPQHRKHQPKNR
jgi:vacuolar-type H+-ATPase subunit H